MTPDSLYIAGFPSYYGGADTELDHLLDLFASHGVRAVLVPMFGAEPRMIESVRRRGHAIEEYDNAMFADRVVVSFCNGAFLERLPDIMSAGPPARVIWFNCMTWLFPAERAAHARGWIDDFGFISRYQRELLVPQLSEIRGVRELDYHPFFNVRRVRWAYREWNGTYRVGRISRDDGAKYAPDTWRIFDRILVPRTLAKKVYMLGYGPNAAQRVGPPPPSLDWLTWSPNAIPATEFYRTVDTLVQKTGGSRESYSMVLLEAYAHGVVPVVENAFAFPDLIVHGETGFLSDSSDEMSYYATWLAWHPEEHRRMAENGRRHLEETLVDEEQSMSAWRALR